MADEQTTTQGTASTGDRPAAPPAEQPRPRGRGRGGQGGRGGERGPRRDRDRDRDHGDGIVENVIAINRVAKVVEAG